MSLEEAVPVAAATLPEPLGDPLADVADVAELPSVADPTLGALERYRVGIFRRVFSFLLMVFISVFLGASIAGIIAGIGFALTLAAQHAH